MAGDRGRRVDKPWGHELIWAETDRYVAFGSEYRALVGLPGIEAARIWEPEPAAVYFWDRDGPPGNAMLAA